MSFEFSWSAKDRPKETTIVEPDSDSPISSTLLKLKDAFMTEINVFMEQQNLTKEDVALFEEVVSEDEEKIGVKRSRQQKQWGKFKKARPNYGKKSR